MRISYAMILIAIGLAVMLVMGLTQSDQNKTDGPLRIHQDASDAELNYTSAGELSGMSFSIPIEIVEAIATDAGVAFPIEPAKSMVYTELPAPPTETQILVMQPSLHGIIAQRDPTTLQPLVEFKQSNTVQRVIDNGIFVTVLVECVLGSGDRYLIHGTFDIRSNAGADAALPFEARVEWYGPLRAVSPDIEGQFPIAK